MKLKVFPIKPAALLNLTMSDSHIAPSLPSVDSNDEYPQVTQADLDRAVFRVELELTWRGRDRAHVDEEQLQLRTSDRFWALICERRIQDTMSGAELERRLHKRSSWLA